MEPKLLLHLGWYVEPGRFWNTPENVRWVEASLALLRAFAAAGGRRAVLAGTSAEYDWDAAGEPCNELRTPLRPATLYGAAKHPLHAVAAAYADEAGFDSPGVASPSCTARASRTAARAGGGPCSARRRACRRRRAASQVRDFMHVEDVGAAFAALWTVT